MVCLTNSTVLLMKHDPNLAQESFRAVAWVQLARYLATLLERDFNERELQDNSARILTEAGTFSYIASAIGESLRQDVEFLDANDLERSRRRMPLLSWSKDGTPFIILGRKLRNKFQIVHLDDDGTAVESTVDGKDISASFGGAVTFKNRAPLDVWENNGEATPKEQWFWGSIKPLTANIKYMLLAALVGNSLAVGVSLFSLQVWDRVIPAQSINSLTVLALGAIVAVLFELVLRLQRAWLIDDVGKKVDLSISSTVFGHMLDLKPDARPQSLGSVASQIREINQIRESISSSMLSAAIDLPFTVIFIAVIYVIGGALAWPIVAVIPIVLVIGISAQFPLARLAKAGLEEASLRNGLIVETVLKADEIKLQQAEPTMKLRWERAVDTANTIGNKQRRWRNFLTNATQSLQQFSYISVICYGAISVIAGDLTMGQVIACSILANRSIAPLMQLSQVMGAFQSSRVAKTSIDGLMQLASDTPNKDHLRRDLSAPDFAIQNMKYIYPGTEHQVLELPKLEIKFGEKIGVIGKIGSGKSTLLRILSGLAAPSEGSVRLDGTELGAIHPNDLRRATGFLSQNAALMRGSIRDNLLIARPSASDDELVHACEISGAMALIRNNPRGLDMMINEAGEGLSGGQKQSLLLARTILRDPPILLMDEPTASMDDGSEANFTKSIHKWADDKTVVIATHRMRPLKMVDRLIVVNEGRIVMDGPKDQVLAKFQTGKVKQDA